MSMRHSPIQIGACRSGGRRAVRGQSITEFVIVIPILLLLILGTIQLGLLYIAKSTLNQAAFTGARAGAVTNASMCSIRQGVIKGLTPLYLNINDGTNSAAYISTRIKAWIAIQEASLIGGVNGLSVDILNPSNAAFTDFQQTVNNKKEIPNSRLLYRSTSPGSNSGESIQDANLLKIRVHYCYKLIVPFVSGILSTLHSGDGGFTGKCYAAGGAALQSDATILMQSPAMSSAIKQSVLSCTKPSL